LMPINKVAIFLMAIGLEKGQNVIALMDTSEIKAVVSEIRGLKSITPEIQEKVWSEFTQLGYEEEMKPPEILTIMRFLFNGSKITEKYK